MPLAWETIFSKDRKYRITVAGGGNDTFICVDEDKFGWTQTVYFQIDKRRIKRLIEMLKSKV